MSGKFLDWTVEEYEAQRSYVRSTSLKVFVKTPQGPRAYYKNYLANSAKTASDEEDLEGEKPAFTTGKLLHQLLLEKKRMWFVTKNRKGTNKYKDEEEERWPLKPIKQHEECSLLAMYDAVMSNPQCRKMIEGGGFTEQTIVWEENVGGRVIPCKCRLDFMTHSGTAIVDLKTSVATDIYKFGEQIWKYGYEFSAAFYKRGLQSVPEFQGTNPAFYHMVVNKEGYAYLWPLHPSYLAMGANQVRYSLKRLAECLNAVDAGVPDSEAWPDDHYRECCRREFNSGLAPKEWVVAQSNLSMGMKEDTDPDEELFV